MNVVRFVRLAVIVATVVATAKLLDADSASLCASAPFDFFGERCAELLRYAILLVPVAVGMFLGFLDRGGERRKRRKPARP